MSTTPHLVANVRQRREALTRAAEAEPTVKLIRHMLEVADALDYLAPALISAGYDLSVAGYGALYHRNLQPAHDPLHPLPRG